MKVEQGNPLPLGIEIQQNKVNFAAEVSQGKEGFLLLYHAGESTPFASYPLNEALGESRCIMLADINSEEYEYNFEIDGQIVHDPYAQAYTGRSVWGEEKKMNPHEIRGRIYAGDYDWEEDRPLQIPYDEVIAYALHVRGFTKDSCSPARAKGTFQGVIEMLPYLNELGINQIQCMPVYEFEENGRTRNYWGYGEAHYFAPKSAYAIDGDGVKGLKDMVKACHKAGIEVVLEMPFAEGVSYFLVQECLRYYMIEYHIDGFILNPYVAPFEHLRKDPILKGIKLMKHQTDFQSVMRRFLKGDEGMLSDVIFWLSHGSLKEGIFNEITSHNGFTLCDLVSYNKKHNEKNGESNKDGQKWNNSWNCGAEGSSTREDVVELRKRQMKNAYFLLLLSQGTPCLLSGDEFKNSQQGNNNVYCQDNPIGWVNWGNLEEETEWHQFVKELIALRKEWMALRKKKKSEVPEVSYHGEEAWKVSWDPEIRHLGVYYGAGYYVAYNMYWEEQVLALPTLEQGKNWYVKASTEQGVLSEVKVLEEQRIISVPARTVLVLVER